MRKEDPMNRQLKRFELPESKAEMSKDERLDKFLKRNGIELLPFQKEIIKQMSMSQKIYICYPSNNGRTDFRLLELVASILKGENDERV